MDNQLQEQLKQLIAMKNHVVQIQSLFTQLDELNGGYEKQVETATRLAADISDEIVNLESYIK